MKIKKIDKNSITFDNNNSITYDNELSFWEFSHGKRDCKIALFEAIPLTAYDIDFDENLRLEEVLGYGFKFGDSKNMISVPCYNYKIGELSYLEIFYDNSVEALNSLVSGYKDIDSYSFLYCIEHFDIDINLDIESQLFKYFEIRNEIVDRKKRQERENLATFMNLNPFQSMFEGCGTTTAASIVSNEEVLERVKEAFDGKDNELKKKILKIIQNYLETI